MTREEVIQLALDIGLRAARTYKYRGSLEAMTEPERKELEQLLEFANKIIQRDEALLRQALEALEHGAWDTLGGRNAAFAIRDRLGLEQEQRA